MQRERLRVYRMFLVASDVIAMSAAFFFSYWFRADVLSSTFGDAYPIHRYFWLPGVALPISLLLFGFSRLYDFNGSLDPRGRLLRQAVRLAQGMVLVALVLSLVLFTFRLFHTSRLLVFLFLVSSYIFILVGRLFVRTVYLRNAGGRSLRNLLIIGTGPAAQEIARTLGRATYLAFRVLGFVSDGEDESRSVEGHPLLGAVGDIRKIVTERVVDEVVIVVPAERLRSMETVLMLCEERGINVRIVFDFLPSNPARLSLDHFENLALVKVANAPGNDMVLALKRVLDIGLACLMLAVFSPLFVIVPILIKMTSPGPVFFRQIRCGLQGRRFTLLKFRSMEVGAEAKKEQLQHLNEAGEPIFKIATDPRLTSLGRLLRKTSVDELPQVINVLKGDMSLVGPRPPMPEEVERYKPAQRRRLSVKPGLTGLWQVRGRSELGFEECVTLDLYYIDHWSILLDLKILLRTVPAVLGGRGAR